MSALSRSRLGHLLLEQKDRQAEEVRAALPEAAAPQTPPLDRETDAQIRLLANQARASAGTGNVRTAPAPAITEIPGFKVYDSGTSTEITRKNDRVGGVKTYEYVLVPQASGSLTVPGLSFSYFDPAARKYVRLLSNPIDISVEAASEVAMSDVVGAEPGVAAGPTELTEVSGGILANYSGPDLLVSQQVFAPTWAHGTAVMAPPVVFGAVALGCRRARRLRNDHGYARKRSARRRALRRLREARHQGAPRQAEATAQALGDYVADTATCRRGRSPACVT